MTATVTGATNLLVFLSDRCNMACDYCFLDLNHGPATVLGRDAALAALREHLARAGAQASVTFLGGEPLVHGDLLEDLAGFCAAQALPPRVNVVSNGTLLDPARLARLQALGAGVTVSLDGAAAPHDRHRRLVSGSGSAHGAALARLPAAARAALKANMVVSADTAASLARNVEALRQLGFRRVSFHLDVAGAWEPAALSALAEGAAALTLYYRALRELAPGALEIANLDAVVSGACDRDCACLDHSYEDLVLGADGRYYPCDAFFKLPMASAARWAVGDTAAGVDWVRRERMHNEAKSVIHAALERAHHYNCPRETYFLAVLSDRDPGSAVRAYHRADNILGDALRSLATREGAMHV